MESNSFGFEDDFMATMLSDFLDESQGYLSSLNDNLLVLDELVTSLDDEMQGEVDIDLLNEMFRAAHSLKGVSAMLQLDDINRLTHKIENVFDAARGDKLAISRNVVDTMFQAFDRLTNMVDNLKEGSEEAVEYESLVDQMATLLNGSESAASADAVWEIAAESLTSSEGSEEESLAPLTDEMEGVVNDDDIPNKYLTIFIDETVDTLDSLNDLLLDEDDPQVDDLLVVCHRIKGSAAAVGLHRAAKVAHVMEDGLQSLRDKGAKIGSDFIDGLIVGGDALRQYVENLKAGELGQDSFSTAYEVLTKAVRQQDKSLETAATTVTEESPLSSSKTAGATDDSKPFSDDEWAEIQQVDPQDQQAFCGAVTFAPDLPLVELKAKLILARLDALGSLLYSNPEETALDANADLEKVVFAVATTSPQEVVESTIDIEGVIATRVFQLSEGTAHTEPRTKATATAEPTSTPGVTTTPEASEPPVRNEKSPAPDSPQAVEAKKENDPSAAKSPANGNGGARGGRPNETIRVDIDRLDHLMNLAGQLVINKARFVQIGGQLKGFSARTQSSQTLANANAMVDSLVGNLHDEAARSGSSSTQLEAIAEQMTQVQQYLGLIGEEVTQFHEARTLVNDLSEAVHQLDRVSDGIQKSVMDTRMVPIGPLFGRFKRVIRDTTRSNGKDVQLIINGEKTELDKRMIDELGDPLIHMVRNAADHGIESPEDREAVGKARQGKVTLDATHRGNRIEIEVRDDGKGLDPEKLKAKAVSKGLITQEDADRLTTQQAFQLIWEPGFSTAEVITEVSGRGMGMDIVRAKIEQLNGTVELASELGKGTAVTIRLPLTVAIMPSLLSVIDGAVFAVPVESVVEIVQVSDRDLATVHGKLTARLRGRVISVVELSELFHWHDGPQTTPNPDKTRTLVIVGSSSEELGIVVDSLVGEEDLVIKTLAENFEDIRGLAGASILGNGRVSLILDVATLLEVAQNKLTSSGR